MMKGFSGRAFRAFMAAAFLHGGAFFLATTTMLAPAHAAEVEPNDSLWSNQWYLRQIHAPEAWSVTTGSRDVIVAVIDGGTDIEHPDLRENIWRNEQEVAGDNIDNDGDGFVDDTNGWNYVTKTNDVRPLYKAKQADEAWSHGTIISSLIAARGNDEQGMAGVSWNARIMPLVVLDADGGGEVRNVIAAMRFAVNHGASIINLSLVGTEEDPDLQEMIQRAKDAGVLVIAATGNADDDKKGQDLDMVPLFPVCGDGIANDVLGVSGTDTLDQRAPYANFGKHCTDVAAPAQQLFAARPTYGHVRRHGNAPAGYINSITGTSLATPIVAGVAALVKSVRPAWTPAQIIKHLRDTATPIEENLQANEKGKMGAGRVDAGRALSALAPPISSAPSPTARSVTEAAVFSARRFTAREKFAASVAPLFWQPWVPAAAWLLRQLL